jgi:dUTPase
MQTLQFTKVRKVKSPCRAHEGDAGIDFFVPEDLTKEVMDEKVKTTGSSIMLSVEDGIVKSFTLEPKQSVLIPSGIKVKVPSGYML